MLKRSPDAGVRRRLARLRPSGALPAGMALVAGVLAAALAALAASITLDPAGARGRAAHDYPLPPAARAIAPSAVTSTEIAAAGRGTPGEALLRWWQDVQLGAAGPDASGALAVAGDRDRRQVERELETVRYVFDERKPRLIDAEQDGARAAVLVVIVEPDATVEEGARHQLERFEMVRTAGRWQIAPDFIHRRHAAETAFARATGSGSR